MEAKLSRKVSHRILLQSFPVAMSPGKLVVHVGLKGPQHFSDALGKIGILKADLQLVIGYLA